MGPFSLGFPHSGLRLYIWPFRATRACPVAPKAIRPVSIPNGEFVGSTRPGPANSVLPVSVSNWASLSGLGFLEHSWGLRCVVAPPGR